MLFAEMAHPIVFDCDWFVIEDKAHIKKLSYAAPSLGKFGVFSFTLPPGCSTHRASLQRQSYHSHHLPWSTRGDFNHDQVPTAISIILQRLCRRPSEMRFLAKGAEKCLILEEWLPEVINLEESGCPKYEDLTKLPKTTRNKALIFSLWYASPMSSPQPRSAAVST